MASGWVKSLQCKSRARALDDVVDHHHNQSSTTTSTPRVHHHLLSSSSSSCSKSVQNLKDVIIETAKHNHHNNKPRKKKKKKPKQQPPPPSPPPPSQPQASQKSTDQLPIAATRHSRALTELPEGHPSRNVVEIIFHTSWSPKYSFSGRVEMVFKVQNPPRTLARFEEYREAVKSISSCCDSNARCVADGNELMRFQCLLGPPSADCATGGAFWAFNVCRKGAICTFSGSGEAHESGGVGGGGRRAMLVCRVIAGRVCDQFGFDSKSKEEEGRLGFNSVSGECGELLVFDSRAVLPCFLIIYQL